MNIKGRDFNLFSNMGDAEANQNMWSYCNYNSHFVGKFIYPEASNCLNQIDK